MASFWMAQGDPSAVVKVWGREGVYIVVFYPKKPSAILPVMIQASVLCNIIVIRTARGCYS